MLSIVTLKYRKIFLLLLLSKLCQCNQNGIKDVQTSNLVSNYDIISGMLMVAVFSPQLAVTKLVF